MKCLLISLQSNAYLIGLKYIAANMHDKGHDARILLLPGYLEQTLSPAITDFIQDYNPDLIGISLMSIELYPAKNLTLLLREKFKIPIIWGGVQAILLPEECLKHADYICYGEGEWPMVALLEHLRDNGREVPNIPNIWTNSNGRIIKQPQSPPEMNLDSLPSQGYLPGYYYGFHKNKIYNFSENPHLFRRYALYGGTCHMIMTTRGCPFHCGYCANSFFMTIYGKKIRERSVENVMEELKQVKKDKYVLYTNIEDDCFFVHNREWIRKFCDEYKKHINLPFIVRAIPTMLDREKLSMLKKAGLSWIVMGVQSGSDHVNFDIYQRRVRFSSVMRAAELILESRAALFCEMIVDNPYETEADKMETVNSMTKLKKPFIISMAHLTFYPGTPLTAKGLKDGIVDPERYFSRYPLEIDKTYLNKLLKMTPYIPGFIIEYLNKPEAHRGAFHSFLTNSLYFTVKVIEPAVYMFIISRSLNYNVKWILKTVMGNWKSALSKIVYNYLGAPDLEYGKKLATVKSALSKKINGSAGKIN